MGILPELLALAVSLGQPGLGWGRDSGGFGCSFCPRGLTVAISRGTLMWDISSSLPRPSCPWEAGSGDPESL